MTHIFPAKVFDEEGNIVAVVHIIADRDLTRFTGRLIREVDAATRIAASAFDLNWEVEEGYDVD